MSPVVPPELGRPAKMKRMSAPSDFVAGIFFITVAAIGLWALRDVRLGTSMRMGPGYLPTVLCYLLLLLGACLGAKSFVTTGAPLERWYLRPLLLVLGALFLFSIGVERLGLFTAIVLLVVVAAFATSESRWKEVIVGALALATFSTVLFIYVLGLPISAWPRISVF